MDQGIAIRVMNEQSLQSILVEMKQLSSKGDPETVHPVADRLLVRLVELLSIERRDKFVVEQIVRAWEELPKWYS
jgi:hypothetical protein